jgi:hypothetical protein
MHRLGITIAALCRNGANAVAPQVPLCSMFILFAIQQSGARRYWAGERWKATRVGGLAMGAVLLTLVFLMLAMLVSCGLALADYIRDLSGARTSTRGREPQEK